MSFRLKYWRLALVMLAFAICMLFVGCQKSASKSEIREAMAECLDTQFNDFPMQDYYDNVLQLLGVKEANAISGFWGTYEADTGQIQDLTIKIIDKNKEEHTIIYKRDRNEEGVEDIIVAKGSRENSIQEKSPVLFIKTFEANKQRIITGFPDDQECKIRFEWIWEALVTEKTGSSMRVGGSYSSSALAFRILSTYKTGEVIEDTTKVF